MFRALTIAVAVVWIAPLLGFTPAGSTAERAREATFDAALAPDDLREWMRRLSARPHHVGSPYDADNARYLQGLLTGFGFDARIEHFEALFPTPTRRVLELTAPTHFVASLQETPLASDPTSAQTSEQLPLYNAYSRDGDVNAELVYVNYGVPADYDELARHGIDVRGKIVIVRYGESWRGIKPKVAAEHGAVGCIIYSDPRDDGYWQGDAYPLGVERNPTSAQRGSVADIPIYPGDPSSPGVGSVPGVKHLPLDKITTLTKIPVLPISATDAAPLLAALGGPVAPAGWRGALPFTYHLGAGPARVHLALAFDWKIRPLYDVVAKLRGSLRPDEWVIRGNHHDAWVNGAEDPLAGTVALLAEAKAIGTLARAGDVPKRTIVFTLWDGEEPGLLGSTAWVETHQAELTAKAAVYVNSDTNDRGYLFCEGSHSLQAVVSGVADDVIDPERQVSVKSRELSALRVATFNGTGTPGNDGTAFKIDALGSGSDFSSFIQHAGVATLDLGYGGEDDTGSYHSIFDSFAEYTRLKDGRNFAYGVTLAKTAGRIVLRFANSDILPYEFSPSATTIAGYVDELKKLLVQERTSTTKGNALIADGSFAVATDPRTTYVPPTPLPAVPSLDFSTLDTAAAAVRASAAAYDAELGRLPSGAAGAAVDTALIATEKALLGNGLPGRPWYRHELYAPGLYTGYGVKTMPAIREAIEQRDWSTARAGIVSVSVALTRYAAAIDAATRAKNAALRHKLALRAAVRPRLYADSERTSRS
jgi:N-acetylated-alpha-linked acidic dipeptidase